MAPVLDPELTRRGIFSTADLDRRVAELRQRIAADDAAARKVAAEIAAAAARGQTLQVSRGSLANLDRNELAELLALRERHFGSHTPTIDEQPSKNAMLGIGVVFWVAIAGIIYWLFFR
jgi:hypothetical protein